MTKNKTSFFKRMFTGLFSRKKSVKNISSTTESATEGVNNHSEMFGGLMSSGKITHKDVRNLAKTLFNTDLESNLYCFRSGGPYGLVLCIESVHFSRSAAGAIEDIGFVLKDCSLDTSLRLMISVKDMTEMLRPFFIKLPSETS